VPYVGGSSISSLAYADGLLAYTADTDHLVVIDALTGGTRYSIPNVPGTFRSNGPSPSLVFDVQGNLIAYTVGPGSAAATQLGANSGTRLWIQPGSLGGATAPTLMGQSLLGAGPGQYYAYDQATGQVNHFVASALSGGGGAVIASDLARKQFYVPDGGWLTAYSYVDNDHITQLWSVAMSSLANAISLGKNGDIYTATSSRLIELDPATGQELRSVSGTFAPYAPPVVQGDYVWVGGSRLYAYDMATLTPIVSMPAASPDYYSYLPAAADDSHLIVNYVNGVGSNRGFLVYAVPEPSAGICTLGIGLILLTWRPRLRSILYHQTTGSSH
jgi:outer membrane protein assembly factor BamB